LPVGGGGITTGELARCFPVGGGGITTGELAKCFPVGGGGMTTGELNTCFPVGGGGITTGLAKTMPVVEAKRATRTAARTFVEVIDVTLPWYNFGTAIVPQRLYSFYDKSNFSGKFSGVFHINAEKSTFFRELRGIFWAGKARNVSSERV
jgi:hypothetical protein